jgi:Domain of unknown function (DUF5615)
VRALLDEHLSAAIAAELRSRGLDVQAVTERPDLVRKSDEELMDIASAEGRAVVTSNIKDFRPIAARRLADGRGNAGLILLPTRRSRTLAATARLADGIESIMRANPAGIANSERWVPPSS